MKPLPQLIRESQLLKGVVLEVRSESGASRWYPLRRRKSGKHLPKAPVELGASRCSMVFWRGEQVILSLDISPPQTWTFTSFWDNYCVEEPDQPWPACRVYTNDIYAFLHDKSTRA